MAVGGLVLVGWLFEARALLDSIDISTLTGLREAGRMPFYAGCKIEPTEWSATETGIRFSAKVFLNKRFCRG